MQRFRSLFPAILAVALVVIGVVSATGSASADTTRTVQNANFDLTTSPVFSNLTTTPGTPVSTQIWVRNNASAPVNLSLKLMKFKAYSTTGEAEIVTPSANDPSVKWVSFSRTSLTAEPGQLNNITMKISPDNTAAFGYYYAVVFTKQGTNTPAPNVSSVSGSSAILVLLDAHVPGEKRQLQVASFKPQHAVSEFLPANFVVTVKNVGNVHAIPTGDIFITRDHKTDIATLPINAAEGNVLPGSSRSFTATWDDGFPAHITKRVGGQIVTDKAGHPQTTLSWDTSKLGKFRIGKYYAHLVFVYNNGTQDVPIESEVSFWVFPWKIAFVTLLIVALVGFGLFTVLRKTVRLGRRAVRRDGTRRTK